MTSLCDILPDDPECAAEIPLLPCLQTQTDSDGQERCNQFSDDEAEEEIAEQDEYTY